MDMTGRKITKIAREVGKFTVRNMRREGVGAAEFDIVHLVRHNPGITQTQVVQALNMDKGAAAKRVASLENKAAVSCSMLPKPQTVCAIPRRT